MKTFIMLAAVIGAAMQAFADKEIVGGFTWSYRINGDTAEIYNGSYAAISPKPTGSVAIPNVLGGKPVTSIGDKAFYGCTALTGVSIHNGVTSIGKQAFMNCEAIAGISIPDSVTSIGDLAFHGCEGLSSISIPFRVTIIGKEAFSGCSNLASVTMAGCVANIGKEAFSGCSSLTAVHISDIAAWSMTSFADSSANPLSTAHNLYLNGLPVSDLTIPDYVPYIGDYAFYECSGLTSATIGSGVTSIGKEAFKGCSGLSAMIFNGNAPTVGSHWGDPQNIYVRRGSTGWDVDIPGRWKGIRIDYANPAQSVEYGGDVVDSTFAKAQTVIGAMYDANGGFVGTVEIKIGKKGKRDTYVRIQATATLLVHDARTWQGVDTKKVSAGAVKLAWGDEFGSLVTTRSVILKFRPPIGEMEFVLDSNGKFMLKNSMYVVTGAEKVGGLLAKDKLMFNVVKGSVPDFGKDGALLDDLLPKAEPVSVKNGKRLECRKVASVKYKKDKATGRYELTGLDDPKKQNKSGLKLAYAPKTGIFTGTFKIYATTAATTPEGRSPKLKGFTMHIIGFMIDGIGYGQAYSKKPAVGPWNVWAE